MKAIPSYPLLKRRTRLSPTDTDIRHGHGSLRRNSFSGSTRHAAGGLLWLAAAAVGHQELLRVRRHHHATRSPRLTRAKAKDRAPPPPALPAPAPAPAPAPRLAAAPHTRTRTRSRRSRSLPRSNPPPEFRSRSQKVPTRTANRLDHRRWRFMKGCQEQCLIYHDIVRAREILTRPTVPSRKRSRAARARTRRPRALPPPPPRKLTG